MSSFKARFLKWGSIALLLTAMPASTAANPAEAGWNTYIIAETFSLDKNKHSLRFYIKNEHIKIKLTLGAAEPGVFDNRLPVYRIDDNTVHDFNQRDVFKNLVTREGRWIMWDISMITRPSQQILEFMNGNVVIFQYYRNDGKIMETSFDLTGLQDAMIDLTCGSFDIKRP